MTIHTWPWFSIYMNGSVKEPNMFHNYETEKITRKASDTTENLQKAAIISRIGFGELQSIRICRHSLSISTK